MRSPSKLAPPALAILALAALYAAKPAPVAVEFPGQGAAADPAGHYFVEWRAGSYASPNGLLLTDVRTRTSVLFWEFRKRVNVLWATDGRHLAVTDYGPDDVPDVLVFRTSDPNETPVRLSVLLERTKGLFKNRLTRDGPARLEAAAWRTGSVLQVRAYSRPDGQYPYETTVEYRLGGDTLKEVER